MKQTWLTEFKSRNADQGSRERNYGWFFISIGKVFF